MGRFRVEDGVGFFSLANLALALRASLLERFSNQLRELVALSLWCWQVMLQVLLRGCL